MDLLPCTISISFPLKGIKILESKNAVTMALTILIYCIQLSSLGISIVGI